MYKEIENKTNFLKVELIRVTVRVKVKTTKGTFCNLEELYTQILSGKLRYTQIHSRYTQIHSRYTQIHSRYTQIHSDTLRYTQILSGTLKYTQGTLRYTWVNSRYTQVHSGTLKVFEKHL